jgi:hypothetical protein
MLVMGIQYVRFRRSGETFVGPSVNQYRSHSISCHPKLDIELFIVHLNWVLFSLPPAKPDRFLLKSVTNHVSGQKVMRDAVARPARHNLFADSLQNLAHPQSRPLPS